jgi:hypothetical protein
MDSLMRSQHIVPGVLTPALKAFDPSRPRTQAKPVCNWILRELYLVFRTAILLFIRHVLLFHHAIILEENLQEIVGAGIVSLKSVRL